MIIIAWYNLIGVIVGIVMLYYFMKMWRFEQSYHDIRDISSLGYMLIVVVCAIFLTIWGGIFWW